MCWEILNGSCVTVGQIGIHVMFPHHPPARYMTLSGGGYSYFSWGYLLWKFGNLRKYYCHRWTLRKVMVKPALVSGLLLAKEPPSHKRKMTREVRSNRIGDYLLILQNLLQSQYLKDTVRFKFLSFSFFILYCLYVLFKYIGLI